MLKTHYKKLTFLLLLLTSSSMAFAQGGSLFSVFDLPHLMAYLTAALMIAIFVMIYYNRVYFFRLRQVVSQSRRLSTQMGLVMDLNSIQLWVYDIRRSAFYRISPSQGLSQPILPIDFSESFDRDDFLALRRAIQSLSTDESPSLIVRGPKPAQSGEPRRVFRIDISVFRRDHNQSPSVILGTQTDVTDSQQKSDRARHLRLRYETVFNSSLVDMFYYNTDGILTDINQKACETFRIPSREFAINMHTHINDIPPFREVDFRSADYIYASNFATIHDLKEAGLIRSDLDASNFYYEIAVSPLLDDDGSLAGIVTAGRNITDMVESHHHQKENTRLLQQTSRDMQNYIDNINFSLKVSDVRLMNYYPDTHELEISSDLSRAQYRLPQLRAITMICEQERRKAKGLFRRMDRRHPGAVTDTLKTLMRDPQGRAVYLHFNVMPIRNAKGDITHYFGMCRNETEMVYTEMRLRQETNKAQETEQIKNAFLLNMSYELRTPLSAVIGFAELFNQEHSLEDEPVFAEEIKKNTGELLKLINGILFISRLDARMIEYHSEPCDFATMFDGWCYMGWSTLPPNVKAVVDNPYHRLVATIDSQNLGLAIQTLCTYIASTVIEGIVRAKYEYRHGELMITIEDTGPGIDKSDLPHVFERFVRNKENQHFGSGLELPIVQELIEQMGGTIELQSERGKGSSFFISMPCQSTDFEKKSEIIL